MMNQEHSVERVKQIAEDQVTLNSRNLRNMPN